ncbi:unnamed protein product [Meloidogyne enterolobii]|uniref:Uncharacterized protein n=2 Tax=Meloidogyne enterolobii TaxID=390850 RepID=A0ACB0ZVV7_MELEN
MSSSGVIFFNILLLITLIYQQVSRSSNEVTRTSSFEYEDVSVKRASSPPSSIEGDEYPRSIESERMLSGISMRSLRTRVPWEKKGVYHHFIHFSHILSQSNMIKFPYFPFIFAYVSAYLFVGVPVLCVEMALGQFASVPPVELFRKMCPSLAGIGTVMLALLMFKAISMAADSTQATLSALYTIREGFRSGGPLWNNCTFSGSSHLCFRRSYTQCYEIIQSNTSHTLAEFNSLNCHGWIRGLDIIYNVSSKQRWRMWRPPHLDFITANVYMPIWHQKEWFFPFKSGAILLIIWTVTGFLIYIGIRKLGKTFVCLKGIIGVAMLLNMLMSLYYTPADADWHEFFKFDLSPLSSFGIWADAVGFVIVSLALGTGSVQKISSLSDFNENFFYNALITSAADILFSLISGITHFSSIASMAHRIYPEDEIPHRIKFMFTHEHVTPITMFPEHIIWSTKFGWIFGVLHYLAIGFLGITHTVVCFDMVKFAFEELVLKFKQREAFLGHDEDNKIQFSATCGVVIFGIIASIGLIGPNGITVSKLWIEFSSIGFMLVSLSEIFAINIHYGFRRYLANVQTMLQNHQHKSHLLYTLSAIWYYLFAPTFIVVTILFKVYKNKSIKVLEYSFPSGFQFYGWMVVILAAM